MWCNDCFCSLFLGFGWFFLALLVATTFSMQLLQQRGGSKYLILSLYFFPFIFREIYIYASLLTSAYLFISMGEKGGEIVKRGSSFLPSTEPALHWIHSPASPLLKSSPLHQQRRRACLESLGIVQFWTFSMLDFTWSHSLTSNNPSSHAPKSKSKVCLRPGGLSFTFHEMR